MSYSSLLFSPQLHAESASTAEALLLGIVLVCCGVVVFGQYTSITAVVAIAVIVVICGAGGSSSSSIMFSVVVRGK
jgi:multidrug efflux pump subunit AcrB